MASDFLTSSYLQYKADTDAVATWLVAAARNCGFPVDTLGISPTTSSFTVPQQPSKRLKGKARKSAREAASKSAPTPSTQFHHSKHTIALKDFVNLANHIAAATETQSKFQQALLLALTEPSQCDGSMGCKSLRISPQTSNLKRPRTDTIISLGYWSMFSRPCVLKCPPTMKIDPVTQLSGDVSTDNVIRNLANRFEALDVQEPSEAFLTAPEVTPQITTDDKSGINYEAERMQDFEEACFGFNLLIRDFNHLRTIIGRIWKGYQLGYVDLVSASVTTNSAIDIARQMQGDVQQLFDRYGGSARMLNAFYAALCWDKGEDPDFREHAGDDMNFRTYDIAQSLLLPTFTLLYSFSPLVGKENFLPYKPGYFGDFDRASNRSEKSAKAKFLEDKIVLMEILSEFLTLHRISSPQPFEDEFTRGLRKMFDTHEIPLWPVFGAQVFLDIHHTLRNNVQNGFADLTRSAKAIEASIRENLDFHSSLRIEGWPKRNDGEFEHLLQHIHTWVDNDPTQSVKEKLGVGPGEAFKLMKWHPILCGIWTYNLKVSYQELCLSFQAAWGSIMYAAHLYNALCKEKLLPRQWIDMDLVMSWHEEIFVGEPPSQPEDYLKRFNLSMGWSAASYARNRRQTAVLPEAKSGPKTMKPIANVSRMFMDRYCNGSGQTRFTEADLKKILAEGMWNTDEESEGLTLTSRGTKAAARKRWENFRRLTAIELLENLRCSLQCEALELSFDYLALHRVCWRMLRTVKQACDPRLRNIFGSPYLEKESQLPFVVGYIFMAVTGTDRLGKKVSEKGGMVKSRLLMCAAEVVEGMIEGGAGSLGERSLANQGFQIAFEEGD